MDTTITTSETGKIAQQGCPEMRQRQKEIKDFLNRHGLEDSRKIRISGDASHRRYQRIFHDTGHFMLMDSPVDKEPIDKYLTVAELLRDRGFSVPKIIHAEEDKGLALIEDFGNTLFSKFFHDAAIENVDLVQRQLYNEALNILIAYAQQGLEAPFESHELPEYSEDMLENEVNAFADWFLPEIFSGSRLKEAQHSWRLLWRFMISSAELSPQTLVHRDFHVDNLCWLDDREGLKRVGILDFQDAVRGRRAYDVVSLLEDARRDVPRTLQAQLKQDYIRALELDETQFNKEYAFFGAQRNAKILGYFVRLYRRDGKPRYLAMVERVWDYFMQDIQHASLDDVQQWINKYFDSDARRAISDIVKAPLEDIEG